MTQKPDQCEFVSVFNDVLGPIMRGPSSSHTAGSYRIGHIARALLGDDPVSARFTFASGSSIALTCQPLGVDLALAAGIMGCPMTDETFPEALKVAEDGGINVEFEVTPMAHADHPNFMTVELKSRGGNAVRLNAKSVGGGVIEITELQGWPVSITGKSHETVLIVEQASRSRIAEILGTANASAISERGSKALLHLQLPKPLAPAVLAQLQMLEGVEAVHAADPVFYVRRGAPLFASAQEMCDLDRDRQTSLGKLGREYEATLLGLSGKQARDEMLERYAVMRASCWDGLRDDRVNMLLLKPTAGTIHRAESQRRLAIGGLHTRAATRAMAVMHTCNSRGVVCAAPTGGSAGVIPAVMITLAEEFHLSDDDIARLLFAAGAIGLIVARRSGFAAEVAGCQVEIGAAGAMAAAAVVEFAGGTVQQATDAAAIALQNTMGSICDPVQGTCEIPCHTRNAVAAANAFVCADLVLGGYHNPIGLDETLDASLAVGKVLPSELRCTAKGGIAVAPSALKMQSQW